MRVPGGRSSNKQEGSTSYLSSAPYIEQKIQRMSTIQYNLQLTLKPPSKFSWGSLFASIYRKLPLEKRDV
jgi:hypothetical protein